MSTAAKKNPQMQFPHKVAAFSKNGMSTETPTKEKQNGSVTTSSPRHKEQPKLAGVNQKPAKVSPEIPSYLLKAKSPAKQNSSLKSIDSFDATDQPTRAPSSKKLNGSPHVLQIENEYVARKPLENTQLNVTLHQLSELLATAISTKITEQKNTRGDFNTNLQRISYQLQDIKFTHLASSDSRTWALTQNILISLAEFMKIVGRPFRVLQIQEIIGNDKIVFDASVPGFKSVLSNILPQKSIRKLTLSQTLMEILDHIAALTISLSDIDRVEKEQEEIAKLNDNSKLLSGSVVERPTSRMGPFTKLLLAACPSFVASHAMFTHWFRKDIMKSRTDLLEMTSVGVGLSGFLYAKDVSAKLVYASLVTSLLYFTFDK